MRKILLLSCVLAAAPVIGCGGGETKTIRRETVQTVPAPVVQRQTTIETVPAAPAVIEKQTTIRSGSVERRTETIESED